jgi:RES domain-containing protein
VMVRAYRICKRKYAETMWSGIGARDYGGRWNSKGVAVVYTAENRSLAALEQLIHLVKPRVLRGYVLSTITFDEDRVERIEVNGLPVGWDDPVTPPVLRAYGDKWVAAGKFPVLAVPSASTRGEWNFLINPAHPEFDGLAKSDPEEFVYDDRLG